MKSSLWLSKCAQISRTLLSSVTKSVCHIIMACFWFCSRKKHFSDISERIVCAQSVSVLMVCGRLRYGTLRDLYFQSVNGLSLLRCVVIDTYGMRTPVACRRQHVVYYHTSMAIFPRELRHACPKQPFISTFRILEGSIDTKSTSTMRRYIFHLEF